MMRLIFTMFLVWVMCGSALGQLPDGFVRQQVVTGLNPTKMVLAPDGRIFIAEKHGVVRIIRDDQILEDPFLSVEVDDNNERGLAGITLDPEFESNHYVYIYYTVPGLFKNRVSRFTANGDRAIPGSEQVIFELDELRSDVHNGGDLRFGFDGKLYVTTGDGGFSWVSESTESLLGKVLRINPDGSIPEDNPYYSEYAGKYRAIYASGFRNPFTSAMHPITGELYINDVGAETWEEINHIQRGKFYGWSSVEGFRTVQNVPDHYADPLYAYDHDNGCAAVGATIYEPETFQFPEKYWGKYFFGDYCTGEIRIYNLESQSYEGVFMTGADRLIYLITHFDGSIYYLERRGRGDGSPWDNTSTTEGVLGKIFFTGSGAPFISIQPKSEFAVMGEPVEFSVEAIGEGPLSYQWFDDGVAVPGATEPVFRIASASLDMDQSVINARVWNMLDTIESMSAQLSVTDNQRPVLTIISPEEGATYGAGDSIPFFGIARDPESGNVPLEKVGWRIDFHHDEHTHPATNLAYGFDQGTFDVPAIGEIDTNVFYRFYLLAEDDEGLRNVVSRDVYPRIVQNTIQTIPSGLLVNSDGKLNSTPLPVFSVEGLTRTISAPKKQVRGDSIYFFKFWSDGSQSPTRQFDAGDRTKEDAYTAEYRGITLGKGGGWTVSYFDNLDLEGPPVAVSQDSAIDYLFHTSKPHPLLPDDYYSVRWEGYLLPYLTDHYQFSLQADDGVRMWIGDELVIDDWTGGVHYAKGSAFLEEGKLYPVKLEYFEHTWGAFIILKWLSSHFGEEVIPATQMYPADAFDFEQVSPLQLSPNPASTMAYLSTYAERRTDLRIEIRDMLGRLVFEQPLHLEFGQNRVGLDISRIPMGSYFLQCLGRDNEPVYESALVIQR